MIRFESQYLRQVLIDNSDKALMQFCCICYYQLEKIRKSISNVSNQKQLSSHNQPWFLLRTFSQLTLIFKDKSESPILKFKATKMITYLLLMNQPEIYKKFELELFPLIKNICFYNKSLRIQQRGYDYFKKNKYYDIANIQQRQKIKIMGGKFVIFCLQVVYMMNKWIPLEAGNRKQLTEYGKAYDQLIKEAVKFPQEQDFIFFSEQKVTQILKNVQKCQQLVKQKRFSLQTTKLIKYNSLNKSSGINSQNNSNYGQLPSNLQKQLNEKQSVINEFRQSIQYLKEQKQFLIKQFQNQKHSFKSKLLEYEKQLQKMYYEVKYLRKKLKKYQNKQIKPNSNDVSQQEESNDIFNSSFSSQRSDIIDLKQKIRLLIVQNMKLKQQNITISKKLEILQNENFKQSRKKVNQINIHKRQLIEELLKNDCKENKEFQKINKNNKNLLYENQYFSPNKNYKSKQNILDKIKKKREAFDNANFLPIQKSNNNALLKRVKNEQNIHLINSQNYGQKKLISSQIMPIFEPYYSTLSSQLKIRLKKCLIKSKDILYKDNQIQIGIKSQLLDQITIFYQFVITNISAERNRIKLIKNIVLEIINKNSQNDIRLKINKSFNEKKIGITNQKIKLNKQLQKKNKQGQKNKHANSKSSKQNTLITIFQLASQQQISFSFHVQINNIHFQKGILMKCKYQKVYQSDIHQKSDFQQANNSQSLSNNKISYQSNNSFPNQKQQFGLILPISKVKLIKGVNQPFQNNSNKKKNDEKVIIKLFYLNRKVVNSLSKLMKYYGCEQNYHNQKLDLLKIQKQKNKLKDETQINKNSPQNQPKQISIRIQYLGKRFTVYFGYIKPNGIQQLSIQDYSQTSSRNHIDSNISDHNKMKHNKAQQNLVKMIIHYQNSTSYILADNLAAWFLFILSRDN